MDETKYMPFSSYSSGFPNFNPLVIDYNIKIPESEKIKCTNQIVLRIKGIPLKVFLIKSFIH